MRAPLPVEVPWGSASTLAIIVDSLRIGSGCTRGSFGIVDTDREDVEYEEFEGHSLDSAILELTH